MKKIFYFLLGLTIIATSSSCNNDDDVVYVPVPVDNALTSLNDGLTVGSTTTLALDEMVIYTPNSSTDDFVEIYILGDGMDVSTDGTSFSGTGPVVYIKYYGPSVADLTPQNLEIGSICEVSYATNIDLSSSTANTGFTNIAAGTTLITQPTGSNVIKILGLDASNNNVQIFFDDDSDDAEQFNATSPFDISWTNAIE